MPDPKKFEKQFLAALRDIFVGAKVEGDSGYINLMRVKSRYYEQGVFPQLQKDISAALRPFPDFREELFDKLYTFFQRYFSESGSIYFRYTALHQNVYEKVYTDDRDVMLFWKTHMLYYVKTDRIFTSLDMEVDGVHFFFDASTMELKKSNEKRQVVYAFRKVAEGNVLVFEVSYSEKGKSTKVDDILKAVKKADIKLSDETLENAFRVFEKQSEVDYFINKNARAFLQEQFELWMYQYLFAGQNVWEAERLAQLQALKAIAFKVIDFISQFEDELVKIWNKPKFVRNSHYIITLDHIVNPPLPPLRKGGKDAAPAAPPFVASAAGDAATPSLSGAAGNASAPPFSSGVGDASAPPLSRGAGGDSGIALLERILTHPNITAQIDEWRSLGMVDDDFESEDILLFESGPTEPYTPDMFAPKAIHDGGLLYGVYHLPYNPRLVERARELRKNMTPAERKLWNGFLRGFRFPVLRQRPIDHYIVDFYCAQLKLVIEIDGDTHYTEEGKAYDDRRTEKLEGYGLRVLRFTNIEVERNFEAVCQAIAQVSPPYEWGEEEGRRITEEQAGYSVGKNPPLPPLRKGGEEGVPAIAPLTGNTGDASAPPLSSGTEDAVAPPLSRGAGGDSVHPQFQFLPLDTRYFPDLELDILALFDDLDAALDGWLVHSENYQVLNTLLPKFRGQVKCIHIDPPYNTETSGFLYANTYLHSSWLTMMENRISTSLSFLTDDGSFLCHIDENEYERLHLLFEQKNLPNAGTVVWDKRNPMNASSGIAKQHEYIIWRSKQTSPIYLRNESVLLMLSAAAEIVRKHGGISNAARKEYTQWIDRNPELSGGEKAYRYLDDQGQVYQSVSLRAPEPRTDPKFFQPLVHPVTKKPCSVPPNGFSRTPDNLQLMVQNGEILFGDDETIQPRQKVLLTKEKRRQISSVVEDAHKGKADLDVLNLDFPYCHPTSLYEKITGTVTSVEDITLDFFAGSGTTAHAVMNLNRNNGGRRKYILVEMGEHFNTVILPRIKKVAFCNKWKDGKPVLPSFDKGGQGGMSHFVKYYDLEQYEDALRHARYQDADLFDNPYEDPYNRYVFLRDAKLLDSLEVDYANNKVHFHPERLYPPAQERIPPGPPYEGGNLAVTPPFAEGGNLAVTPPLSKGGQGGIDLAETLSHLRGKWIRRITADYVEFQDGERLSLVDPDWQILKPLIWW